MATQKPISTISYNTEAFLVEKLNEWYNAHIIQSYQYIKHKGEDGDKDHIHLRIEPNKRIDPMNLSDELIEYVHDNPLPLRSRPWRASKEEDWILYVLHDEKYLKLKYGAEYSQNDGKIPYQVEDLHTSEGYDIEVAVLRARQYLKHSAANIVSELRGGKKALDLVEEGVNPFTAKAILTLTSSSDYEKVIEDYHTLEQEYRMVCTAIENSGLTLCIDDSGKPYLM